MNSEYLEKKMEELEKKAEELREDLIKKLKEKYTAYDYSYIAEIMTEFLEVTAQLNLLEEIEEAEEE